MNRSERRLTLGFLFAAATVGAISFAIYVSLDPKNYYFSLGENRATWVYDPRHVLLMTGLMLAEASCAGAAMFSPLPFAMWLRCLLGLSVLVPWAVTVTPFVLHMPGYVLFHHLWVWLLILMLILVALGTLLHQLLLRVRQGRLTGRLSGPA